MMAPRKFRRWATALFMFSILYMTLGLYIVQERSSQAATRQAISVNNRTTCALRNLVDTPIAGYRRTIKIQQAIVDDPGRGYKTRATAQANIRATNKTLDGLLQFRAVYSTIPPDYKCRVIKPPSTKDNHT